MNTSFADFQWRAMMVHELIAEYYEPNRSQIAAEVDAEFWARNEYSEVTRLASECWRADTTDLLDLKIYRVLIHGPRWCWANS